MDHQKKLQKIVTKEDKYKIVLQTLNADCVGNGWIPSETHMNDE